MGLALYDLLRDGPEKVETFLISHPNIDRITDLHIGRPELAAVDLLDHALFGQAGGAAAAIFVGYRAASQDGPGGEGANLGDMLDELKEAKVHGRAGVGVAEKLAIIISLQRQIHPPVLPVLAKFVGRDGKGRKHRGGLGLEEPKVLGKLGGDEISERIIIENHQ